MRIAFLTTEFVNESNFSGGLANYLLRVCLGLKELGHKPKVFVITDLTNYSMPFIRYEISDIGVLSEDLCPCGRGFPLLKEIKGCITNTIVTPDGRYIHGEYFTHLFYHVPGVKSFQARQRSIDKIEVAVQPDNGFEPALIDQLIDKIRSHFGRGVEVQWSIVPEIPPAPSGKRHFTISDIPIDFTSLGTQG